MCSQQIALSVFLVTIIQKAAPVFVQLPVIPPEDLKDSASYQKSQSINEDIMLLHFTVVIDGSSYLAFLKHWTLILKVFYTSIIIFVHQMNSGHILFIP
ncbi:uncharacterized protein C8R40DRAFT_326016 [Lentinula edodes]|uniref:uncharacterized protein n=1 Tax=Lentinula edodes TaxID=5353 RepID=UPI001E8D47BD|nr:uncharacterized protein C8R40DRAFT_326016 [Lentinula edodes]KAH7874128.1 hypothetical protein C8R40DRAFT_326016 [Lentinula edodes]